MISVGDIGSEGGSTVGSLLGVASEDRYLRFLRYLDRASRDPDLAGVLIKIEGAGVGLARADEVRGAIERLRAAGKKVYAYILSVGDAEYLMASACDGIFSASEAMYIVDGVRSAITYFGGAAEQLGITVDVARVGAYKSFPDQFTRKDMSDEQRETLNAYLDTADSLLAERVTARRGMTVDAWKAGLDEGIKPPRRAKELGQIDDVVTPQQLDEKVKAGGYASGSEIVREGLRGLQERATAIDRWLTDEVILTYDRVIAGVEPMHTAEEVRAGARALMERVSKAAE